MITVNRPEFMSRLLFLMILLSALPAPAYPQESPTRTDEQSPSPSETRAIDTRTRQSVVVALASSLRENYFDIKGSRGARFTESDTVPAAELPSSVTSLPRIYVSSSTGANARYGPADTAWLERNAPRNGRSGNSSVFNLNHKPLPAGDFP